MTEQTHCSQPEPDHAFVDKVTATINRIKQSLQVHGNDIDLVSIDQNRAVTVRVHKRPEDQEQVYEALEIGITEMIKQRVPQVKEIVTV